MLKVGIDSKGSSMQVGDICRFKIRNSKNKDKLYEGIIMYDDDFYCYSFLMQDDNFPCINMYNCTSIERIVNVFSTKVGDEYEFYRKSI